MDKVDLAWADILRFLGQPNAQSIEGDLQKTVVNQRKFTSTLISGSTLELLKSEPQLKPKLFDFLTKR